MTHTPHDPYSGFTIIRDEGVKRPKGYRKAKSRLKASRSPVYLPTSDENKEEAAKWLRPRR